MFDVFRSSEQGCAYYQDRVAVDGGPLDGGLPDSRSWVRRQRKPGPDRGRDRQERLTIQDVRQRLQMLMRNRQVPKEMVEMYAEQTLNGLINERVMAYEAERLGFEVTPEDMLRNLQVMAPMLFQNGQFIGKEQYAALLREQDLSISEFEASTRVVAGKQAREPGEPGCGGDAGRDRQGIPEQEREGQLS